jgi:branched-chain amino acid transport system permease protein
MPSAGSLAGAVLSGLGVGALFAIAALGLSLVFGVMRLINLAHGEFLVLGAYIAWYLGRAAGISPLLAMLIAASVLAIIAYPLQYYGLGPVMSRGASAPLLITFGISIVLQNVFILAFSPDVRSLSAVYSKAHWSLLGQNMPVIYFITIGLAILVLGLTHVVVSRTVFGLRLRASSEDPAAAGVMGVDVRRVYAATFAISAGTAAIGGVLLGLTYSFAPLTGATYLVTGFAVVVLGGVGSIKGTLIGGLLLGVIESLGATFVGDGWRTFIGFVLFLIVLSVRPQGLFRAVGTKS